MKICNAKLVELDPTKYYWLVIRADSDFNPADLKVTKPKDGVYMLAVDDISDVEFIENVDRVKGIIVKEF